MLFRRSQVLLLAAAVAMVGGVQIPAAHGHAAGVPMASSAQELKQLTATSPAATSAASIEMDWFGTLQPAVEVTKTRVTPVLKRRAADAPPAASLAQEVAQATVALPAATVAPPAVAAPVVAAPAVAAPAVAAPGTATKAAATPVTVEPAATQALVAESAAAVAAPAFVPDAAQPAAAQPATAPVASFAAQPDGKPVAPLIPIHLDTQPKASGKDLLWMLVVLPMAAIAVAVFLFNRELRRAEQQQEQELKQELARMLMLKGFDRQVANLKAESS